MSHYLLIDLKNIAKTMPKTIDLSNKL